MLLGAVAGLAGGTMSFVGRLAGFENVAAIIAGIAMILAALPSSDSPRSSNHGEDLRCRAAFLRPAGKLMSSSMVSSKFFLGLLLGFLPCGLVYAALMKAVGAANPAGRRAHAACFWYGNQHSLWSLSAWEHLPPHTRVARWGTTVSAFTVLVMGALLIARGIMAGAAMHCSMHHMGSM